MSDVAEKIVEIKQYLSDIEESIITKQSELDDVLLKIELAKQDLKDSYTEVDKAVTEHRDTIRELEFDRLPIEKEVQRLKGEMQTLIAQKGEVMQENRQLSEQNTHFVKYESEARKVLKATENSLIEREKAVRERESLRPINRSILPPEGQ